MGPELLPRALRFCRTNNLLSLDHPPLCSSPSGNAFWSIAGCGLTRQRLGLFRRFEFTGIRRPRRTLLEITGAHQRGVRHDNFADFQHLLEPPQVIIQLLLGFFAEKFRDSRADHTRRRVVLNVDFYDRAAIAGSRFKTNRAGIIDIGVFQANAR